ncbi:MAG TPA: PLP-dependent aminotransferase family protein [Solirubrobacteraceae bacterium]
MTQIQTTSGREDGSSVDLLVTLDRAAPRGLRRQLEGQLRDGIRSSRLSAGSSLPSSRLLAQELGVARSVVVEAYGQLIAEGYLEARRGAGTQVAQREGAAAPALDSLGEAAVGRTPSSALPDPAWFPRREWLRQMRAVLTDCPDAVFGYPHPQGAIELRRSLSEYLGRVRAVQTRAENVLVCGGFAQGLAVLCRGLQVRGVGRIAVEDPCFSLHRRIIRAAGLEPVPVAVDDRGLVIEELSRLSVGAVLVAPAHSYPTGVVLAPGRRHELLAWAQERDALVIEDDYDAEFRYDRTPVGALQGLDPDHVVYGGSASKTLSPALRLGWLALPDHFLGDVLRAKFVDGIATEAFGQLALARFIDGGSFARHLRRVRPVYRARRDRLAGALRMHMPQATVTGAAAGLHLFVRLSPDTPERELVEAAHQHGLHIDPSSRHWANPDQAPPAILIGYGTVHQDAIEREIATLAALARELSE